MFHHSSSVDNSDVLELVDPELDLDLLANKPSRPTKPAPLQALLAAAGSNLPVRTVVNDLYQPASSAIAEKSADTTSTISTSSTIDQTSLKNDESSEILQQKHKETSDIIVDEPSADGKLFSVNASSEVVVGDDERCLHLFDSTTAAAVIDNETRNVERVDEPMDTSTTTTVNNKNDVSIDNISAEGLAVVVDDLDMDPKIAECKKELIDVERRINELENNVVPAEDEAIGDDESADSSSDTESSSGTESGEKSDSSKADKGDDNSGSDSKKRKVSPMAVEEERKEKRLHHSKAKKVKSSHHGDHQKSKFVKDDRSMKTFFDDSRYFLIKSANSENVILSKAKGVWSTTPRNEQILNKAFRETRNVILVFSVEKSQAFQGFCRLASEAVREGSPVNWVLPPGMNARNLGGVFKVHWINRNEVPFANTAQLYNPWNEYKPVKIGRDGTELAPNVGRELCGMFAVDESIDLSALVKKVKKMQDEIFGKTNAGGRRRGGRYSEMRRQWGSPPDAPQYSTAGRYSAKQPSSAASAADYRSSAASASWRDYGGGGGGSSSSQGGRYKDLFMNGSYYDYIREYSMSSTPYSDPYANAYQTAHPYYNDPYYAYGGYAPQPMYSAPYERRPTSRNSPPPDKYYGRGDAASSGDYYYARRDAPPPPPPRFGERRRRRSQSPEPPSVDLRRTSHRADHRSKSPRRPSPTHRTGGGGYSRRSGKY